MSATLADLDGHDLGARIRILEPGRESVGELRSIEHRYALLGRGPEVRVNLADGSWSGWAQLPASTPIERLAAAAVATVATVAPLRQAVTR